MFEGFWSKVEKTDDCWNWTTGKDRQGYGKAFVFGRDERAHRVAYVLTYGAIPDGMNVLHSCDNPSCVRPDHLFLGTTADNCADMWAKGRGTIAGNYGGPPLGEANPSHKLSEWEVAEIRRAHRSGETYGRLATRFGVSPSQISRIVRNVYWATPLGDATSAP